MNKRRIIFILEPFEFPAGGVAVIYDHVDILSLNGFNAFVALSNDNDFALGENTTNYPSRVWYIQLGKELPLE
jgi:hypothetical protein